MHKKFSDPDIQLLLQLKTEWILGFPSQEQQYIAAWLCPEPIVGKAWSAGYYFGGKTCMKNIGSFDVTNIVLNGRTVCLCSPPLSCPQDP